MLILRWALHTLILFSRSVGSHHDGEGTRRRGDFPSGLEGKVPVPKHEGLLRQRIATAGSRLPTVFVTLTTTVTISATVGDPVTSTIFITQSSTSTFVDTAKGQTTETFTVTKALPQKRAFTVLDSPATLTSPLPTAAPTRPAPAAPTNGIITSTILVTVRTVITIAPTVFITSTAVLRTTLTITPPVSTTVSVTAIIFTGASGFATTVLPTATPISPATRPQLDGSVKIVGIFMGLVVAAALFVALCLFFRRRRKRLHRPSVKHTDQRVTNRRRRRSEKTSSSSLKSLRPSASSLDSYDTGSGSGTTRSTHRVGVAITTPARTAGDKTQAARAMSWRPKREDKSLPVLPLKIIKSSNTAAKPLRSRTPPGPPPRAPPIRPARDSEDSASLVTGWPFIKDFGLSLATAAAANSVRRDDGAHDSSHFGGSNEAQPPSPVASSGIFGPHDPASGWSSDRDSADLSTLGDLPVFNDNNHRGRGKTSGRMSRAAWYEEEDDDDDDDSDLWIPAFPVPSVSRPPTSGEEESKKVRFESGIGSAGGGSGVRELGFF